MAWWSSADKHFERAESGNAAMLLKTTVYFANRD